MRIPFAIDVLVEPHIRLLKYAMGKLVFDLKVIHMTLMFAQGKNFPTKRINTFINKKMLYLLRGRPVFLPVGFNGFSALHSLGLFLGPEGFFANIFFAGSQMRYYIDEAMEFLV